ncbi:RlpA-like double-psi beta-barrel domain-containing protein [Salipaludibacillus sp. HK11]|uniref:RlpA-like double-psi beta-barrel domain-containing protein n=1 Tax=Salipaludibacillus sp. HK11 TaxID=3394320 RepID=UPI0039FD0C29
MYANDPYYLKHRYFYPANFYSEHPYSNANRSYPVYPNDAMGQLDRQQAIRGQASWTEGGTVTRCDIPWSQNQYMTVGVGVESPYRCGETLYVRNLRIPGQSPVAVTVVDQVPGYQQDKINLHRVAFEALGANLDEGIIDVEIIIANEVEEDEDTWGSFLQGIVQTAYSEYTITNEQLVEQIEVTADRVREIYEFTLQSTEEEITVKGQVVFNPNTNRLISFDVNGA